MRFDSVPHPRALLSLLAVSAIIAAACSGDGGSDASAVAAPPLDVETGTEVVADAPSETAAEEDVTEVTPAGSGTGLINGLADHSFAAAVSNSYWYSRYTLGSLVMMSGLGIGFAPPMESVLGMVQAVDQGPAEGEHVVVPGNPALLRAVFASGDPQFASPFNDDPMDLSNFRWDLAKADTTLTPSAQAQTIIKELAWAKFFNNPGWTGGVTSEIGAMDRFKGMVMYASAKTQLGFALNNLRNDEGLFVAAVVADGDELVVSDARIRAGDQFQMLQALSSMRWLLQHGDAYNSVYLDPDALDQFGQAADDLFTAIQELAPEGIQEAALGLRRSPGMRPGASAPSSRQRSRRSPNKVSSF